MKPSWGNITVNQYQELNRLDLTKGFDDFGKIEKVVCIIYELSEKAVNELKLPVFKQYAERVSGLLSIEQFPGAPRKYISKGLTRFSVNYNIPDLTIGQYVSIQSFAKKPIDNMHYILACIVNPLRFGIKYKNDTSKHLEYAEILSNCKFIDVYHSSVYFLQQLKAFNKNYPGLFGSDDEGEEGSDVSEKFNSKYGWIYSVEKLAELKRITLDQAYNTPIREAFNYLSYLKAKSANEREQVKGWQKR